MSQNNSGIMTSLDTVEFRIPTVCDFPSDTLRSDRYGRINNPQCILGHAASVE